MFTVNSEHALSLATCERWFIRFKSGHLDVNDKEHPGQSKNFENAELQALDEDATQTQEQLAEVLNVTQQAISDRL